MKRPADHSGQRIIADHNIIISYSRGEDHLCIYEYEHELKQIVYPVVELADRCM